MTPGHPCWGHLSSQERWGRKEHGPLEFSLAWDQPTARDSTLAPVPLGPGGAGDPRPALPPRLPLLRRICGRCGRRKGPCSEVHFLHGLLPCREVCDGPSVPVSTKWVKSWFDQGAVILQGRAISKMTPSRLAHRLALPGGCWCTASPRYYQDWPRQSLGAPERGRPCCSSRVGSLPLMALRSSQFPQGHDTHQGKHA